MATVIYRPGQYDPASVEWGGVIFPANVPVEVSNPHILKKALGNPFFEAESEAPPAPVPPPPDDSGPDEKSALVAEAEALGIDVDKRWGISRLKDEIAKAKDNDPQQA